LKKARSCFHEGENLPIGGGGRIKSGRVLTKRLDGGEQDEKTNSYGGQQSECSQWRSNGNSKILPLAKNKKVNSSGSCGLVGEKKD